MALYFLRPFFLLYFASIRDEMGVAGGVENLQWFFTGTLVGMILVNPPFAALVAKLPRVRFIAIADRFFIANLLIFILFSTWRLPSSTSGSVGSSSFGFGFQSLCRLRFWALMVDVFDSEQGKRLFGFIAAGETLGGIAGSSITASLAKDVPATYLLLGSAYFWKRRYSVRDDWRVCPMPCANGPWRRAEKRSSAATYFPV